MKTALGIPKEQLLELDESAYLRPLEPGDVTMCYVNGLNDPLVNRFMGLSLLPPQTFESVTAYVRGHVGSIDAVLFGLFISGKLRGTCRLHNIASREPNLGIALFDRSIWGRGWGSSVVAKVAEYAIVQLGCRAVRAGVASQNTASHRMFAKAGFLRAPDLDHAWLTDTALMWVYRSPKQ